MKNDQVTTIVDKLVLDYRDAPHILEGILTLLQARLRQMSILKLLEEK